MKHLNQFNQFDFARFAAGKEFLVVETAPWSDYKTKKVLGTSVEVVIICDNTDYGDEQNGSNRFEKLRFKVKKQVSVLTDAKIVPVNAVAHVYGDYNNQLSVTCDDIRIVEPTKGQKQ